MSAREGIDIAFVITTTAPSDGMPRTASDVVLSAYTRSYLQNFEINMDGACKCVTR